MHSELPFDTFDTREAVVWIDPLDGTSDFVKGNLPAVTVLIGLSLNGYSRLGIVHSPFNDENPDLGKTIFATLEHGAFNINYDSKLSKEELVKRVPSYMEPFDIEE
jgi:3'-phosphoadenosine 5'-phosphosulfate (PAPS) 3'-phosphatase